jgi:hypothetical protein
MDSELLLGIPVRGIRSNLCLLQIPKNKSKLRKRKYGSDHLDIADCNVNSLVTNGYFCTQQLCRFFGAANWKVLQGF